jgi:hypothetical protein
VKGGIIIIIILLGVIEMSFFKRIET